MNSSARFKNDGGRSAKEAMKIVQADLARLARIEDVWSELTEAEQMQLVEEAERLHAEPRA